MPRKPIDYSKCLIYKLCCNDPSIRDEYYGHTTDKTKRKYGHKHTCHNTNCRDYDIYLYRFIRENGGFDNWSMVIVEEYPCENKNQAEARERYWIETQQATLNQVIPTRTQQEYYEENREEIREKKKKYYEENKEEILECHRQYREEHREKLKDYNKLYREEHKKEISEKRCQKINCECGKKYSIGNKSRHLKSQKHLQYLEQNNI